MEKLCAHHQVPVAPRAAGAPGPGTNCIRIREPYLQAWRKAPWHASSSDAPYAYYAPYTIGMPLVFAHNPRACPLSSTVPRARSSLPHGPVREEQVRPTNRPAAPAAVGRGSARMSSPGRCCARCKQRSLCNLSGHPSGCSGDWDKAPLACMCNQQPQAPAPTALAPPVAKEPLSARSQLGQQLYAPTVGL